MVRMSLADFAEQITISVCFLSSFAASKTIASCRLSKTSVYCLIISLN